MKREGDRYVGSNYHGTRTGYQKRKCRCDKCREWNRTYHAKLTERKQLELLRNWDSVEHGKVDTYKNYKCRCALCRAANTKRARSERVRKVFGL